jgi:PAS domain S-box-containing protein
MAKKSLHILLVEDNPSDAELMLRELRRAGFAPASHRIDTEAEYLENLDPKLDIILSDYAMPQFSGSRALELLKERGLDIPFILVSGTIGEDVAVKAMRDGAADYLLKDRLTRLGQAVEHALEQKRIRDERREAEENVKKLTHQHELILNSAGEGICGVASDGKIIFANPKAAELLGWKVEELLGKPVHETVRRSPEDGSHRGLADDPITNSMRNAVTRRIANDVFWGKNGRSFRAEWVCAPTRDERGVVTGCIITFKDVTEQFVADARLKLQEQQYRLLFETNPNPMWVFDTESLGILAVNDAALTQYGYSRAEFEKLTLKDLRFPEDVSDLMESLTSPKTPSHFSGVFRHKRKDDSAISVEIYSGPIVWEGVRGRIVTAIDVTERKRVQEELRASKQLLEGIVDAIPVRVFWKDKDLAYLGCNAAFARDAGFSDPKEVVGKDDYQLGWRDLADRYRGDDRQVIESGRPRLLIEEPQTTPDGKTVTLLTSKIPRYNSQGKIDGVIGTYMDITPRKQAEERLREQAEIIDRAHDAVIIRDFKTEQVTFWNKGAEHLYGWTASEAIGRPIGQLVFSSEEVRRPALEVLLATGEFHGELKQITKSGLEITVDGRGTIIRDDSGAPLSVLLIHTDITEQKRLGMQLLRAQRLESIGTLASGVAHDLNNILTPILMCAETLRLTSDPQDREDAISLVEQSARRGAAVVKQVLTFARGIEGKRVLIKPSHLIEEMVDIAQRTFPKSIEIRSRYPEDLWSAMADPTQMHQVLLNLCVNARDAMPNGGSIGISAHNFHVDEAYAGATPDSRPGDYITFNITDTGAGMSQEVIDKIFDPFFTTKEIGKGTGLGLSTALGIVRSHGGFMLVDSEVGKGTIFKIFLPAQVADEESCALDVPASSLQGKGECVLLVDDEEGILDVTKTILETSGYHALAAKDGQEAIEIFRQKMDSIRVVVTDMALPHTDGLALMRALQKMRGDIIFVASTGQSDYVTDPELRTLGVASLLIKPYDSKRLLTTLHDVLEGKVEAFSGS